MLVVFDMEGLKCVLMALGELSAMISGTTLMPVWCVGSWDTLHMVSYFITLCTQLYKGLKLLYVHLTEVKANHFAVILAIFHN